MGIRYKCHLLSIVKIFKKKCLIDKSVNIWKAFDSDCGVDGMKNLITRFIKVKNTVPKHANELLDFIQQEYVHGKIATSEYRILFKTLNNCGAEKPANF
jgi:hypothetical protein